MFSGKAVEPLSGSGRLISGEYDNITKAHAMQAILESLISKKGGISNHAGLVIDHKNCHLAILRTATPLRFGTAELCSGTAKPSTGGFQGIDKVWLMVGASR